MKETRKNDLCITQLRFDYHNIFVVLMDYIQDQYAKYGQIKSAATQTLITRTLESSNNPGHSIDIFGSVLLSADLHSGIITAFCIIDAIQ